MARWSRRRRVDSDQAREHRLRPGPGASEQALATCHETCTQTGLCPNSPKLGLTLVRRRRPSAFFLGSGVPRAGRGPRQIDRHGGVIKRCPPAAGVGLVRAWRGNLHYNVASLAITSRAVSAGGAARSRTIRCWPSGVDALEPDARRLRAPSAERSRRRRHAALLICYRCTALAKDGGPRALRLLRHPA